jgi:hypothetical protein
MMRPKPLQCPFCDNYLIAPIDIQFRSIEITGGICRCGAIYALDRSGHSLGEIFMDALVFACRGDYDRALSLNPEDYETVDYEYDLDTNTIGRSPTGKMSRIIFIRIV